ncbi:MAG: NDP-sugar synthase [Promethearchaeota archaeon]|nr:MAG: NDP-sugar synthase [Candidatus Lokiarchaeota archaeon]
MKAVILAAGFGTRMGKLTQYLPKPLIPIANKPLIQHLLECLHACNIDEFIIAVGHLENQMNQFLNDLRELGFNITSIYAKNYSKGPIYSFYACLDAIDQDQFLLTPADLYIETTALLEFLQKSKNDPLAFAFYDTSPYSNQPSLSLSKNNLVNTINTKLTLHDPGAKVLLPLMVSRIDLRNYIERGIELAFTKVMDVIQDYLTKGNKAFAYNVKDSSLFEIDSILEALNVNQIILQTLPIQDLSFKKNNDNKYRQVNFISPVLIGKNVQIDQSSIIGPNVSIGNHTHIERNVKLHNTIVCPQSHVPANTTISNAIFFKSPYTHYNEMR